MTTSSPTFAQTEPTTKETTQKTITSPPVGPTSATATTEMLAWTTALAAIGSVAAGTAAWWLESDFGTWNFRDTGYFDRDTYAGGADKIGHAYSNYLATRTMTGLYETLGVDHDDAALLGAGFSILVGNIVEIVDAFTDFGYEYGDSTMNLLGVGLGYALEAWPDLDRLIGFRIGYWPSPQHPYPAWNLTKWVKDYSGQTYFLDFKLAGLKDVFDLDVGALRYINIGALHSTWGYQPNENFRSRDVGAFIGVNLEEVFRTLGDDPYIQTASLITKYVALPYTNIGATWDLNHPEPTARAYLGIASRDPKVEDLPNQPKATPRIRR